MFEYLKGLAMEKHLNKRILDVAVKKRWITKEQEDEILRIVAEEGARDE
nr:MAG TPA: hypothetical protein [Caudoviricetes sp.]